jgi:1,4-dihydroxy-2-naphthoate octaprenyltransferase
MKILLATFRLPFLLLTVACVFLGFSTASASGAPVSAADVMLVMVGALAAHISVNTFNEYFDFVSGLDAQTQRTPFSGGSGALVSDPSAVGLVLGAAISSLGISVLVGLYFLLISGPAIVPIGVIGAVIIVTYTQWLNRIPLLCLLAPGMGFGILMVIGTHYVLTGSINVTVQYAAWVSFFLVNNLLLLNQFPDIEPDASIGRRHVPIAYGLKASVLCFGAFVAAAVGVLVLGIETAVFPKLAYMALIPLLAAVASLLGAIRFAWKAEQPISSLVPFMALNVLAVNLTPVLLGVALLFGS